MIDFEDKKLWLLLPPGDRAILRVPAPFIPEGARQASATDLLVANQGRPFPWGNLSTPSHASKLWKEKRVGYGGLIHEQWFVTTQGRFGGARNVPEIMPGSLRSCFLYDGGQSQEPNVLAENEGFAIIKDVGPENRDLYRKVQMHAAEHVVADGGHIILSPLNISNNKAYAGFVGRCMTCPNPELISFRQLQKAVPDYAFELFDKWKNWSLTPARASLNVIAEPNSP